MSLQAGDYAAVQYRNEDGTIARQWARLHAMKKLSKKRVTQITIRQMAKHLVNTHTTDILLQMKKGLMHRKASIALKYLTFVADRTDGKPTETHRMVELQDGPGGEYDLTKLSAQEQAVLLKLLRKSKDRTGEK